MSVMEQAKPKPSTLSTIIRLANPVFVAIAVIVPISALIYAKNFGPLVSLHYVHIMTGAMWTGIDLFMGFVLGPVIGGMDPVSRANVFRRLVPKMTFMMPVLAGVTGTTGFFLTTSLGYPLTSPKILAALIITGILTVQGFGLLLPNEIRVFRQLLSDKPDIDLIAKLGMRTAKLGGLQGLFQLGIILVMALIRF